MSFDKNDFTKKLDQSIKKFSEDLSTINTRVTANILNPVRVDAYGDMKPLNQIANVTILGSSTLVVQPWDKSLQTAIVKAIQTSGLGLNPAADGGTIKVPIPQITEERRKELATQSKNFLESAKIAMRNIRNHERDRLKNEEKNKAISEDDFKRMEKELQKIFDGEIEKAENLLQQKNKDIIG